MTSSISVQIPTRAVPLPFHAKDPHAYLRLQLPVLGGQGKKLGKVDALEHDPDTGQLTAIVVQHGLLRRRRTQVPAHQVKWVNQDSVIVGYSRSAFQRLPAA